MEHPLCAVHCGDHTRDINDDNLVLQVQLIGEIMQAQKIYNTNYAQICLICGFLLSGSSMQSVGSMSWPWLGERRGENLLLPWKQ
jgi:hypothetical protein